MNVFSGLFGFFFSTNDETSEFLLDIGSDVSESSDSSDQEIPEKIKRKDFFASISRQILEKYVGKCEKIISEIIDDKLSEKREIEARYGDAKMSIMAESISRMKFPPYKKDPELDQVVRSWLMMLIENNDTLLSSFYPSREFWKYFRDYARRIKSKAETCERESFIDSVCTILKIDHPRGRNVNGIEEEIFFLPNRAECYEKIVDQFE